MIQLVNYMVGKDELSELVEPTTKFIQVYSEKRSNGDIDIAKSFDDLVECIGAVIELWVGHTYVGIPKQEQVQKAFQKFYIELMSLLLVIKNDLPWVTKKEFLFADSLLYRGTIYRYLGSGGKKIRKPVEPKYNDIYVSWSTKKSLTPYMNAKLHGVKTLLTANITTGYGISLAFFGLIQQENENEVVYPTVKESIVNVEYKNR